jgi:hypothetical protein
MQCAKEQEQKPGNLCQCERISSCPFPSIGRVSLLAAAAARWSRRLPLPGSFGKALFGLMSLHPILYGRQAKHARLRSRLPFL